MKLKMTIFILLFGVLFMTASTVLAEDESAPGIDPYADQILKQMSEYLKSEEQFTYQSEVFFDVVLEGGQKIRYNAHVAVSVNRPNGFHVKFDGDLVKKRIFYDGESLSIYNPDLKFYARVDAKPTIDDTINHIGEKLGITPPLSDFILSDPYKALMSEVQSATYVGQHELHGMDVHHLAFTQEDIDWEIWIENGKMMVPRMMVITYKNVESSPQYTAIMYDWDLAVRLPDSLFSFSAPEDVNKIEFLSKILK